MTATPLRVFLASAVAVCWAVPTVVGAQAPEPGMVIDSTNVAQYEQFTSPGLRWVIDRGVTATIIARRSIQHPPPVREATEKYSSQLSLSGDGTHLIGQVAGLPFPTIDREDPWLATKIMYNFSSAIVHDDSDIRNFDCDTGSLGMDGDRVRVERHFLIDHIRRLYFRERTEVEPFPEAPNEDGARFKEALYPIIEPFDLKGTGFTFTRYAEHTRQDDTWLYLPQLRRVRRLSSAQRSDALFGQDTDADSYEGYQGNISWMDWTFLGEKTVIATMHANHMPVQWGEPSGDFIHSDVWETRDVWIVEGVSKLPQYAYGKRIIYMDKEIFRIPFTDIYDHAGELWKFWINNYRFAKEPFEEASYGFEWEIGYRPSIAMVDTQLQHATSCALPSHRFPGEQGWYVNLGDSEGTTDDFFALSSLISAGR